MFRFTATALALSLTFGASASAQPYQRGYDHDYHSDDHGGYGHFDDHYHGHRHYYWEHDDHDHHFQPRTPDSIPYQHGPTPEGDWGYPAYEGEHQTRPQSPGAYPEPSPYQPGRKNSERGPRGDYEQPGYQPELTDPRLGPKAPNDGYQGPVPNVGPRTPQYQAPNDGYQGPVPNVGPQTPPYRNRQTEDDYQPNQFDQGPNYPAPFEDETRPSNQGPKYSSPYQQAPTPQYAPPGQRPPAPYQNRGNQQYLPLPPSEQPIPDPSLNGGLPAPPDTLPEILPQRP